MLATNLSIGSSAEPFSSSIGRNRFSTRNDRRSVRSLRGGRFFNSVAWFTTVVMILLTLLLVANGFGLKIGR